MVMMLFMSISFVFLTVIFAVIASGDKRKNKTAALLILALIFGGLNQMISSQYGISLKLISVMQVSGDGYENWNSFANIFTAIAVLILTVGVVKTISVIKMRMIPGLSIVALLFGDVSYRIIPEIVSTYTKEPFASAISAVVVLIVCVFLVFYCAESYTIKKEEKAS